MTGLGRAQMSSGGITVEIIARSVNFRGLDCKCRLPHDLIALEPAIHRQVSAQFSRGRIEIDAKLHMKAPHASSITIDEEAASATLAKLYDLQTRFPHVALPITMGDILRVPGVVLSSETVPEMPPEELATVAVKEALDDLARSRAHEGANLQGAIKEMLGFAKRLLNDISLLARADSHQRFERMKSRVHDLVGKYGVDESRMLQEFALLVERSDFKEEIDRLIAHTKHFENLCVDGHAVGRKLDFLCQEMLRETNTLLSKAVDSSGTIKAIDLKAEIERMREQVQNIE